MRFSFSLPLTLELDNKSLVFLVALDGTNKKIAAGLEIAFF
jgi:hypothetical protein